MAATKATRPKKKKFVLPKSLAVCGDMYYQTRQRRLALQKEVAEIEAEEKLLKDHLIENLSVGETTGVRGKAAMTYVYQDPVPTVADWDKFGQYMWKNKALYLMQKRISTEAVGELLEAGKKVPGVQIIQVKKISSTKLK